MTRSLAVRALIITMMINLLLFFFQLGIMDINPDGPQFFSVGDTPLGDYDAGNYTLDENVTSKLPSDASAVSDSGNIFTDTWKTFKNWFLDSTGLSYLLAIINALPNFLKVIGLPSAFAWGIGAIWHSITLLGVIMFFRGDP